MTVNGKKLELSSNVKTISELLDFLKLSRDSVAIEKNGSIVEKKIWHNEGLNSSDSIEIIKFVGGG